MPSPSPTNRPLPQGKPRGAVLASPRPCGIRHTFMQYPSHTKHGFNHSWGALSYPHRALGAELLPWLFRLGSRPIRVSMKVKTLPSKWTRSLPLFKVLAGLFPGAIGRESYCLQVGREQGPFSPQGSFSHPQWCKVRTHREVWVLLLQLTAVK